MHASSEFEETRGSSSENTADNAFASYLVDNQANLRAYTDATRASAAIAETTDDTSVSNSQWITIETNSLYEQNSKQGAKMPSDHSSDSGSSARQNSSEQQLLMTEAQTKADAKGEAKGDGKGEAKGDGKGEAKGDGKGGAKGDGKGEAKGDGKGGAKGDGKGEAKGDGKGGAKGEGKDKGNSHSEGKPEHSDKKIADLIKMLGSDVFNQRELAEAELKKIGMRVLPALEDATKSSDAEVRRRANRAIRSIETNAMYDVLENPETFRKCLAKAGAELRGMKGEKLFGKIEWPSTIILHDAPLKLSDEDRKLFEKLVDDSAKVCTNTFSKHLIELSDRANMEDATKEDRKAFTNHAMVRLIQDARIFYAAALCGTGDVKDVRKGVELLTEHCKKHRDDLESEALVETAARLGANSDKAFMDTFKKYGGNVDRLNKMAARYLGKGSKLQ